MQCGRIAKCNVLKIKIPEINFSIGKRKLYRCVAQIFAQEENKNTYVRKKKKTCDKEAEHKTF